MNDHQWNRGRGPVNDRAERKVRAAQAAADFLDEIGCHGMAGDVRSVCRSNGSYRETCRRLYLDNVALRKARNGE
jgi:hypothetical protein